MKLQTRNFASQAGNRKPESGFSLITAIFLLVVLATLGAMMVTFFTTQQQSSAKDVLGSRAYQAARAGIEWAAYVVEQQTPAGSPSANCTAGRTFNAGTLGGTLAPFRVVVTCVQTPASPQPPYTDGTNTLYIYDITSTATGVNGAAAGTADYVERVITLRMGR